MTVLWVLCFVACGSREDSPRSAEQNAAQTPIFVDLNGQNWRFPTSTIDNGMLSNRDETLQDANQKYQDGAYREAIKILIPYLQRHPKKASAHALISACFFRINDLRQAKKAALRALEYDKSVISYSNLGSISAGMGEVEESISYYEQARRIDAKHFLPIRNLVTLYYKQRNLEQTEELLYELIKIDPLESYGYVSLGQVLVEQNRWQEAESVYRFRLAELESTSVEKRSLAGGMMLDLPLALANVLLQQNRLHEAEQYFLTTLELSDTTQSTWTNTDTYRKKSYVGLVTIYMKTDMPEKEQYFRNLFQQLEP